jgi:hypothetical protein
VQSYEKSSAEQNKFICFLCRALNFGVQNEAKITNCGGLSILPFAAAPCFCHLLFDFALDSPSKRVVLQLASK